MMRGRGDMGKADEEEEQMQLLSHYYSAALSTPTPPEGAKPKRRRRKRKVEGGGGTGGMKTKRKLSAEQAKFLEMSFGCEHKLESARKDRLAAELGLDPRQVAVWFQNRRARWKSKQLEGEYSRLNSTHNSMTLEKCRLEAEVRQLKEKLVEAEKEIERLQSSAGRGVVSTAAEGEHCSPSTSFSAAETNYHEAVDHEQVLVGGGGGATFGLGGGVVDQHDVDNFLFMADNAYYAPPPFLVNGSVEWMFW